MSFKTPITILKRIINETELFFTKNVWLELHSMWHRIKFIQLKKPEFGNFRNLKPFSKRGFDRGLPIDRYYIEQFLIENARDIRGHALEIGDNYYTRKFGGKRVTKIDVLHVVEGNPKATIVADLTHGDNIPSNSFDCIIFTQTLQVIYDIRRALNTLYRILKPSGILLATTFGISKIWRREGIDNWGEYWRFTTQSLHHLFGEVFPTQKINIKSYGNVLSAIAFLEGLASEELQKSELDYLDPDYEVLLTVRAMKPNNELMAQ